MNIINYTVRMLIVIMGIIIASGLFLPQNADPTLFRLTGIILIVWGIFRIVTYRRKLKRYLKELEDDENDEK